MKTSAIRQSYEWRKQLGFLARFPVSKPKHCVFFMAQAKANIRNSKKIAIDLFQSHAWITIWSPIPDSFLKELIEDLRTFAPWGETIQSIVLMDRSQKATDEDVKTVYGVPPTGAFSVKELGIPYLIRFTETKHPGLFLDHAPLRDWLLKTQKKQTPHSISFRTPAVSQSPQPKAALRTSPRSISPRVRLNGRKPTGLMPG